MFDIAIIGSGPAGLSAAVNAAARNKTCVVLGRGIEASWLYKAENVNNHLGMPNMTGKQMLEAFWAHARSLNIDIREGRVLQALPMGDYFMVNFDNVFVEARTLIIATGMVKKSSVKGESAFVGKGVSYCATCDGMFYRGKNVVVVGETEEGEADARFLSDICDRTVYVQSYDKKAELPEKIERRRGKVNKIYGEDFVQGVEIAGERIDCDGVFFIKESVPADSLVPGVELSEGVIRVSRLMETSVPGVFAAGDCTGWPPQVSKAVGEGLVAAQQAVRYIDHIKK